jgi:hypothetical protein
MRYVLFSTLFGVLFLVACTPEGSTVFAPPDAAVEDTRQPADLVTEASPQEDITVQDLALSDLRVEEVLPPDVVLEIMEEVTLDIAETDLGPAPCTGDEECDDGESCTDDSCVDGFCAFESAPGICCETAVDCDDGISCTDDKCVGGSCKHYLDDNLCCWNDSMCADGNGCTLDRCAGETCSHTFINGYECECANYLDCDDGLECTADSCFGGKCQYEQAEGKSGCCTADSQCADADPITVDLCVQNTCSNLPAPPCSKESHCEDDNPCTEDSCADSGYCGHTPISACCLLNGQCDDGSSVTIDFCAMNSCVYSFADPPTTCTTVEECPPPGPCALSTCLGGFCTNSVADGGDCCIDTAACDDNDLCTIDSCNTFACSHLPVAGFVAHEKWQFETGTLDGFTVEGGGNGVTWQIADAMATSPPYSLYFGDPSGPTLANGKQVSGKVVSPAVTLPATGPHLMRVWAFIDCEPLFSVDVVTIYVRVGGQDTAVWTKVDIGGTTGLTWQELEVDLSSLELGGKSVQIVFGFDSIDASNNDYQGLYFDDIRLLWPCPPGN